MKHLKNIDGFLITEAVGLAEPTLIYSDFLLAETNDFFELFLDSTESKFEQKKLYDLSFTDMIHKKLWPMFPVVKMDVRYHFTRLTHEKFCKNYPATSKDKLYTCTGACYNLAPGKTKDMSYLTSPIDDRTEYGVYLKIEVGALLSESFEFQDDLETKKDEFLLELESTIIHELNHAYEGYQRMMSGSGQISTDLTFALEVNRSKIKKEIFKEWSDKIGFYLYWSEKHEMNAMVQESWPYVKRFEPSMLKFKSPSWMYAQQMRDFSAIEFQNKMYSMINKYYPDAVPEVFLSRLKNGLANYLDIQREKSVIEFENAPSLTGEKIRKMKVSEFLQFVQKRVNIAGEGIQRKILKLYSLK
jgi:hypothetical protein